METSVEKETKSHVFTNEFDIADTAGGDGFWQRRILIYCMCLHVIPAMNLFSMVVLAPNIDHWCARPSYARNLSVEQWRTIAIPPEDQQCSKYKDINVTRRLLYETNTRGNNTISCESWEYDKTLYTTTILSQFNLVCDRRWLVSLSKSVFMFGAVTTLFIFSHLSDWFGRKPVIIISGFISFCCGIVSVFSTSFTMFLIVRYFLAVGATMNVVTPFLYMMEIVSQKYRNVYGLVVPFGFSLGIALLPLIAWLIRDSFWIQIAIGSYSLIFVIAFWLPESPRWLINHGKTEEAEKILRRAAEINGIKISEENEAALKEILNKRTVTYKSDKSKLTVIDLFKSPGLRKMSLNIFFNWFVNAFVYHGLIQNTNELAGNLFVNLALYGILEIPAYLFAIFTLQKLGRRNLGGGCMVIGGVTCFVSSLLPTDPWWLNVVVTMAGKFCITISFGIIFIYATELFPTVVRNIGMGFSSFWGRMAGVIAPFMRELGNATHPIVPQFLFGVLTISSGLLIFLLPDTRYCNMPDTIAEIEEFFESKRNKKKAEKP